MDVKKTIRDELDNLVLTTATAYNDLITEDIPEKRFERAVDQVGKAKDFAEENLVEMANTIVVETTIALEEAAQAKADRLSKMVPGGHTAESPVHAPPKDLKGEIPVKPLLEGPQPALPRDVSGEMEGMPPNMDALVEAAEQSIKTGGMGGSGLGVDIDPTVKVDHDLGMTVAEENRIKRGLPPKVHRPTIHVTGKPMNMNPEKPATAASAAPKAAAPHEEALKRIGRLAAKHVESENSELANFAFKVITIVEVTTGENFTETSEETDA